MISHKIHPVEYSTVLHEIIFPSKLSFPDSLVCLIYIYIYLADAFIQSDLQCIHAIHFLSVSVFPGNWTHNLFALLTQCSTTEPQELNCA